MSRFFEKTNENIGGYLISSFEIIGCSRTGGIIDGV
jgi:hypothetical protein